jgi:predicted flap endonuclease-1-like 5' DNA nuclease
MSYSLEEIEGIGAAYAAKLEPCGIKTTSTLLRRCANPGGRKRIAAESGISEELLLKWANLADLMRVRGVGRQYAELLFDAGVDSVKELVRARRPSHLAAKMAEVNAVRKLIRRIPIPSMIEEWIEEAAKLAPAITY